jgi:hypothetical protein
MKTNPRSSRRKKKPEPVVDIDENIFNPFAPVLSMFRRRGERDGNKKPRAFRHDFALVLLLHVIAILAFVAHGSVKRYTAAQKPAPAAAKKQEKSVVKEIVEGPRSGSMPELIKKEAKAKPGKNALVAVHESDPFLPEKAKTAEVKPNATSPKVAVKGPEKKAAPAKMAKPATQPAVTKPAAAKPMAPSANTAPLALAGDDADKKRAFLVATGRVPHDRQPQPTQPKAVPQAQRAEPVTPTRPPAVIQPIREATPSDPAVPLQPFGGVAWETRPMAVSVASTPQPARSEGPRPSDYTVGPGDNLEVISKRLGVGYEELAALNNLSSSRDLRVGRKLSVPAGMSPL